MKRTLVSCILALLLAALCSWVGQAAHENIRSIEQKIFFTSETVNPSAKATSSDARQAVGSGIYKTFQWTTSTPSGTPNLAIVVLCSVDDVGFYQPSIGGTVTTVTDNNGGIAQISVPMCKSFKLKLVDLSTTVTTTANVTVISQ